MPLTQQHVTRRNSTRRGVPNVTRASSAFHRLWLRLRDDAGAVAIEYVVVAIALLAIAGAIAAALTTLGDDAVEQIPDSVSNVGG